VTAERTVEVFQEEIAQVRKMVRDSETRRHECLAPLRWVASLTDSNLSYDPSFPIEGSFQLPRTSEQKVLGIVALLRRFSLTGLVRRRSDALLPRSAVPNPVSDFAAANSHRG
jgi:hypothetical protein